MKNTKINCHGQLLEHWTATNAQAIHCLMLSGHSQEASLFGQEVPPLEESWMEIGQSLDTFLGICFEERLVGVVSYRREKEGQHCELTRLSVDPKAQGQGVGRGLLKAVEGICQADYVGVEAASFNTPALKLYESMGYVEEKRESFLEGVALIYLVKCLCLESF